MKWKSICRKAIKRLRLTGLFPDTANNVQAGNLKLTGCEISDALFLLLSLTSVLPGNRPFH